MKKKIGIFYVNAGGGHSGTSKALVKEILENYSDYAEAVLVDAMAGEKNFTRWLLERGYALATNNFPRIWRVIYWFSKLRSIIRGENNFFSVTMRKNIADKIEQEKFDVIVTVHFFLTSPVLSVLKDTGLSTPVYCIVTDPFTVPPHWFINKQIKYFVFSELAQSIAVSSGVAADRVLVVPPVVNKKFFAARDFEQVKVREKLGLPLDKKIILVAAGGDGLFQGEEIVRALSGLSDDFRIIVVCGREKKFFDKAQELKNKFPDKILSVIGFAENMEELMAAVNLVVSKAGPATIFETLAVGRPIILTYYIWEQEKGNRDFVVDNGYGKYEPKPHLLKETVEKFFANESEYQQIRDNINRLEMATGVGEIAQELVQTKNPE